LLRKDLDTFILDVDFFVAKTDLIISLIKEGRTDAAIHLLEKSKLKFEPESTKEKPIVIHL